MSPTRTKIPDDVRAFPAREGRATKLREIDLGYGRVNEPVQNPEPDAAVRNIPLDEIDPDPGQPRKTFDSRELSELAASIRANGLLQPITVRPGGPRGYWLVAGERRYRAHAINGAATVRALVIEPANDADVRVKQIIENDQRSDVPALEQARSYRDLMDAEGWNEEELSARIGKSVFRIMERTNLLKLQPEYQALLAGGNLRPSEATELARLTTPRAQTALFNAIRTGGCKTYNDLRATANALVDAEAQFSLIPEAPAAGPSDEDRRLATGFEAQVDRIALMLRSSVHDNQIVAVRKVNPDKAGYFADLFAAMQRDLRRVEVALREAAVQAEFLAAD